MLSHLVAVSRNGIYSTCGYGQRTVGLHQHLRLSNEHTELLMWDGNYDPELSYIPPSKGCQGPKTLSYPHELNGEPSRSNWTVRVRVRWRPQRFPRPPCLTFDPKAKPVTTPTRELYLPKTEDYHCTQKTVPIGKEAQFHLLLLRVWWWNLTLYLLECRVRFNILLLRVQCWICGGGI